MTWRHTHAPSGSTYQANDPVLSTVYRAPGHIPGDETVTSALAGAPGDLFIAAPRADAAATLFCLPYAGGGAGAFRAWRQAFPSMVDLQPIQLPGRENRITEPLCIDPEAVAGAIAARADRPYAIYGHSMGARLGFEVIRSLRRRGARLPVRFYVAASRPPDLDEPIVRMADLPDDDFVRGLENLGGTPTGALDFPELRELLLPVLRADFKWIDGYRYEPGAPLDVPIVGFAGLSDASVPPELMGGWDNHTSGGFQLHTAPGDHFFLHSSAAQVTRIILLDLLEAIAPPSTPRGDVPATVHRPAGETVAPSRPVDVAPHLGGHLVPLGDTGWSAWRTALLRTTGFPADGLDRLAAPALAAAADAHLAGGTDIEAFTQAFEKATREISAEIWAISCDPLFREAVTWQNRNALLAVNGVREQGAEAPRNSRRRSREKVIAQYWQRYCAKNETVGFFGPSSWITLDPQGPNAIAAAGPNLVRDRWVYFEHWALSTLGDAVAADPRVRQWLPVSLSPQLHLAGRQLVRPAQPPLKLPAGEAAILAACDGRRLAIEVARAVAADPANPVRTPDDALILLGQLANRELVRWDVDLPMGWSAERVLEQRLAAIGEPRLRDEALASLRRLQAARDRVAAAAGSPEAVRAALDDLDGVFRDLTGHAAQRRAGEMYAGRTLCVEECVRDLDAGIGRGVLDAMAAPLALLLQAARWLSTAAAEAYLTILREFYDELAKELGTPDVPFGQLWYLAQGLLFGGVDRPVEAVSADFAQRWSQLFGLDRLAPGTRSVTLRSEDLAAAVPRVFPGAGPVWSKARIHSPDLHICADSIESLRRGDFTVVLGELHAAWTTLNTEALLVGAPDIEGLRAALREDLGSGRILPLLPLSWSRQTARLAPALHNETDRQLGFMPSPGANQDQLLRIAALTVAEHDGQLLVRDGDRRWPVVEFFAELLSIHTQGAFKLVEATGHSPRITVDRMVVARETWRTTVGETGLAEARSEQQQYLAVRRWRAALGLPDRIFVSIATETKPFFVDLTSPTYATGLCTNLRAAGMSTGDDVRVAITEMLPEPSQAWVPDAQGRTYFSELRMHITDPQPVQIGPQS